MTPIASSRAAQRASTLVIVLWIAFGLVSITLYFAHSMSFELRASDNRVCGLAAEQAVDGAARYVSSLLANLPTNGIMPDPTTYACQAVPVGESHFWLIGRDTNSSIGPAQVSFGLVDEASKINLNAANSNMLVCLPRMNLDLTQAILDWRDTNGGSFSQTFYAMMHPPYQCKCSPFETVDELRLLYGADMETLVGEDANRNGVLDPNESDENHDSQLNPAVLDCVTVYSREPVTNVDGTYRRFIGRLNSGNIGELRSLLQTNLTTSRAQQILQALNLVTNPLPHTFKSPLDFFLQSQRSPGNMTAEEFASIANKITVTNGTYIEGRINVNTAGPDVLACLPGISDTTDLAQTLVSYRQMNPDKLGSIAWIVEALGPDNPALAALRTNDCITTLSYQFSADVAALGPHGRGYRRTLFVFDTCDGSPRIVYRQDRTHLGWALGKDIRQVWVLDKQPGT